MALGVLFCCAGLSRPLSIQFFKIYTPLVCKSWFFRPFTFIVLLCRVIYRCLVNLMPMDQNNYVYLCIYNRKKWYMMMIYWKPFPIDNLCICWSILLFCGGAADRTLSRVGTLLSSYKQASQWQEAAVGAVKWWFYSWGKIYLWLEDWRSDTSIMDMVFLK